ncbi:hypothetical protein ABZ070_02270 [Streptomyces sp. NPDC006283]|uniref:hypothetical protein n=1 Tax=Streptomyces sp. NPDC006283 TaxID=3156741 RepID=UPI0033A34707
MSTSTSHVHIDTHLLEDQMIPATPGWYVHEPDEQGEFLDPVIAWKPTTDSDGDDILLPFVDGGPGFPPHLLSEESFKHIQRSVIYRPSHDPGREGQ